MEENNSAKFSYNLGKDAMELFEYYRRTSKGVDVTLCCTDDANSNNVAYTQAHKMIITAASPVIKDILKNRIHEEKFGTFIYLAGISQCSLSYLLNYLYNGEVLVPKQYLETFKKAAEILQIKLVEAQSGVKSEFIPNSASVENHLSTNAYSPVPPLTSNMIGDSQSVDLALDHLNLAIIEPKVEANVHMPSTSEYATQQALNNNNSNASHGATKNKNQEKVTKVTEKKIKTPKLNTKEKVVGPGSAKPKAKSPSKNEPGPVNPAIKAAAVAVWNEWKNMHTNSDENGFHCLKCPETKTFSLSTNLSRHYKQAHEQICKFCKYPFINEEMLQHHVEENHQFKCLSCEKTFTLKTNLNRHQKQGCSGANSVNFLLKLEHGTYADPNNNETKVKSKKVKKEVEDKNNNKSSGEIKKVKKETGNTDNFEQVTKAAITGQDIPNVPEEAPVKQEELISN